MIRRFRRLLALDGQGLYDAQQGQRWDLPMFLAQSRSYMRHLPAWKFWPQALLKWPGFHRMQRQDERHDRDPQPTVGD